MSEEIKNESHPWIDQIQSFNKLHREEENNVDVNPGIKLGWLRGVMIPCLLSTWNLVVITQLPVIIGNAGIFHSILIVLFSLFIILITNSSLSAISTNGKLKTGGFYFIISRSIGPEIGVPIGILLAFATTAWAALTTIAGSNFVFDAQQHRNGIINENDYVEAKYLYLIVTTIGIIMSVLGCINMDIEAKIQYQLLIPIILYIFNIIIGSFIGPKNISEKASGFTGFHIETFKQNWNSDYMIYDNVQQSFFTIFTRYFPFVTGMHAGLTYLSGDLQNPSDSIPKGTLLSILITTISHIVLIVVPGSAQLRNSVSNAKGFDQALFYWKISFWPWFNIFIVIAYSISNALSALMFVPKLLQRMGQDDVFPLLKHLSKGYGRYNKPYRAQVFVIIISSILILIFKKYIEDNLISCATICNLSAYAMLNLCTFHVAYFKPLGWRPTYKFYNKWLSLAAGIICILVVIFMDKINALIVSCVVCVLYILARIKKEGINWGSSIQTQQIKTIISNVFTATTIQYHIKNYLPNLIVFSGDPESRKNLVSLAHMISNNKGVQMCVNIEKVSFTPEQKKICIEKGFKWLKSSGIKSFYVVLNNIELDLATHMIYSCVHGQLKPNITMIGYKSDWLNCPYHDLQTYLNIFNVANMNNMSTIMVRVSSTEIQGDLNLLIRDLNHLDHNEDIPPDDYSIKIKNEELAFKTKKRNNGTVDVWWLYNDGGLSLIIAFIFKKSFTWKNCKFRIFGVTNKVDRLSEERHKLEQLLSLYRIDFDYMDIILKDNTGTTTMTYFNSLLERAASRDNLDDYLLQTEHISDTLFLRDLIELHSFNSDLIILTTPKNDEGINILFMCWIETITRGLPPCIIINGSSDQVIAVNT
ncbi:hypothetical protein ACI65C_009446 [Semiaphis heraclei]